jgi:hypothetical protein
MLIFGAAAGGWTYGAVYFTNNTIVLFDSSIVILFSILASIFYLLFVILLLKVFDQIAQRIIRQKLETFLS